MVTTSQFIKRWAFAALVIPGSIALAETKAAVPILPDTFGTVVIGDIPGLLDNIGALASKVMPGMSGQMIKQQAGAMLGDPELAGLPAGSGIAVIIPKEGMPYGFLEVSSGKAADYQKLLKSRGLGMVEDADGLIVAAVDQAGLTAAKAAAAQVKSDVLAGSGSPTFTASVKLADVLKHYDDKIQAGMKSMAEKVESAEKATSASASVDAKSMVSIFKAYYAVAKRIDVLEFSLAPSAEALAMNYEVTPVGGASASVATVGPSAADAEKLLAGNGAIRGQANFDMASMAKFVSEIMSEIGEDGSTVNAEAINAWFKECSEAFGGVMAMNVMTDPASPISGSYAVTIKDQAAALKLLQDMPSKLEATGFTKLYESMGMPIKVTFKEKVREYKGTPIHQLAMNMNFTRGTEEQQKRMKALMGNMVYDVAIVDKFLLYAVAPEKIDDLIDAAKAGSNPANKPLTSVEKLPAGGQGYFDYNIGAAMMFAATMSGEQNAAGADMVKKMAAIVKDTPPLQMGWYNQDGKYRWTVNVPADTIRGFVQAGQQASAAGSSKSRASRSSEMEMEETTSSAKSVRSSGPRSTTTRSHK